MQDLTKRQEEIIQTSVRIIDQRGIQGLTIKNLSKELGVTEGAIYRHFENKKEILISILEWFKINMRNFTHSMENKSQSTFETISEILHHFRTIFESNPAIVSVIFAEEIFQNDDELSEKVADILSHNQEFLLNEIKTGQAKGELKAQLNPQMIVDSILGPFRLMVKKWKMQSFTGSLEDSVNKLLDYLSATIFVH
jgi:AcrR family transcriptional regulator